MIGVEREQHRDDRVPGVFTHRRDVKPADLTSDTIADGPRIVPDVAISRFVRRHRRVVEDANVMRESSYDLRVDE